MNDCLIALHIVKVLCGRGPALVGLSLALSISVGVLLLLIGAVYPCGLTGFAVRAVQVIWHGLH
jgi:hypothetical protein